MNIFGHAWVAARTEASAAFVLGALLPDLEQMVGLRVDPPADPAVARGVACHLRTDAVFHASPSFVELCTSGRRRLQREGVRRGPALAATHVGVEMLIDGFIADPHADRMFAAALSHPVELRWRGAAGADRFERVRSRLAAADIPVAYRDPIEVARRLERILLHRPRLALDAAETMVLQRWLVDVQPEVEASLGELEHRLLATGA